MGYEQDEYGIYDRESRELTRKDDGISIRTIREIRDPVPAFLSSRFNNLPNRRSAVPEWAPIDLSSRWRCSDRNVRATGE